MPIPPNPKHVDIIPRHMGFDFPKDTPKHWVAGDPWSSQLLNALSLTFPAGERSFIESVRAVRDRISDPELLADVRAFIAQEAQHTKEHESFNDWLRGQGFPVDEVYADIEERIRANRAGLSPEASLAVTCAVEHFTAILADAFLTSPELLDSMHENARWLWIWHAIEETEHKAVAYDCYEAIGGSYRVRVEAMAIITVLFMYDTLRFQTRLLRAEGELGNLRSLGRFLHRFWGPRGHFTKVIPAYLDYYRPSFHPWQHDNRATVARFKAAVEARAKRVGASSRKRSEERTAA